ncbi:hypothetical protein DERF_005096 [Dermatophagoides farinae]|uniref:Uncharacterized protein n=1 Tax=Dermatophagoides farinae TaxID=6954 RepID=A0A922I501_DERFA|nr:hypothetical protein DERF_005096 [Dermatophagoides farinae]
MYQMNRDEGNTTHNKEYAETKVSHFVWWNSQRNQLLILMMMIKNVSKKALKNILPQQEENIYFPESCFRRIK